MAELTSLAFDAAQRENGPVQLNIPRTTSTVKA